MAKDNQLTTTEKSGDKLQMNGVNVSKAEVVDMIINEEIAKAQSLLDAKSQEANSLSKQREEKIKALDLKVATDLAAELIRSLKVQARKLGINPEKFIPVLPKILANHLSYKLHNEFNDDKKRVERDSYSYHEEMKALSWLPVIANINGPRFDVDRINELRKVGYSKVGIMLLDKSQSARINLDDLGFTSDDVFDYTVVVTVPFPKPSLKTYKILFAEIKEMKEHLSKLGEECTQLHEWIRKTRNKREEVTAAVTRSVLNTSEEGKQFLGDLDKFKVTFGVRFEDVKLD